jgi:nicotinamide-nucleotide amidase
MMNVSLYKLAETLGATLKKNKLMLATAESCTGGGLSYWVTSVGGSSDWFERGFVTYSNQAKIEQLGVDPMTLANTGAVSEATAREMAEGALARSLASISVSITGIAGPAGGSPDKPVGTVWLAYAGRHFSTFAQGELFTGDRQEIREKVIEKALMTLIDLLD